MRADARRVAACGLALLLAGAPAPGGAALTQADLLRRLIDLDRLLLPPAAGERTGLCSSFDRAARIDSSGTLIDWQANRDYGQFLRRQADGWNVMVDLPGPGALTHLWCAQATGRLRVVLDGQTVIDAPLADLFNGKLPPFVAPLCYQTALAGGYNSYFPIGFARSCLVLTTADELCYQVDYVQFAPGTQVETFRSELSREAQAALAQVVRAFTSGLSPAQILGSGPTMSVAAQQELARGQKLAQTLPGAGIIRALYVSLTDRRRREPYALRRCLLRLYWDGQERPSVEAPLADFFGSGFDRVAYNSLVVGTDNWTGMPGPRRSGLWSMYCYFPMPFVSGARLEIENLGRRKIGLMCYLRVSRRAPPEHCLRFKARYRQQNPCRGLDYAVLETTGPGRFVGCTLAVDCPQSGWWGEGDQKVWVDGRFPAYFGTGTADYFGSVAGMPVGCDPLLGVTRSGPFGKYSAYRWHIADCINFQQVIHFALGNLQPGDRRDTYYASVAYWYGPPQARDFFGPLKAGDLAPPGLRIPNAIEVEGHLRGREWGSLLKQKYAGGQELSGRAAARIATGRPVQIEIPYDRRCRARLKLRLHPRRPFEKIEVFDAAGKRIGTASYRRSPTGVYALGEIELQPGANLVTVVCSGNPVLDCWIVDPLDQ